MCFGAERHVDPSAAMPRHVVGEDALRRLEAAFACERPPVDGLAVPHRNVLQHQRPKAVDAAAGARARVGVQQLICAAALELECVQVHL